MLFRDRRQTDNINHTTWSLLDNFLNSLPMDFISGAFLANHLASTVWQLKQNNQGTVIVPVTLVC